MGWTMLRDRGIKFPSEVRLREHPLDLYNRSVKAQGGPHQLSSLNHENNMKTATEHPQSYLQAFWALDDDCGKAAATSSSGTRS